MLAVERVTVGQGIQIGEVRWGKDLLRDDPVASGGAVARELLKYEASEGVAGLCSPAVREIVGSEVHQDGDDAVLRSGPGGCMVGDVAYVEKRRVGKAAVLGGIEGAFEAVERTSGAESFYGLFPAGDLEGAVEGEVDLGEGAARAPG